MKPQNGSTSVIFGTLKFRYAFHFSTFYYYNNLANSLQEINEGMIFFCIDMLFLGNFAILHLSFSLNFDNFILALQSRHNGNTSFRFF
jgi:hypothetical protein